MRELLKKMAKNQFLFEELVKRDFKKKYKRTILGMGWSILNPLLQLFVMRLVFSQFFGSQMRYYTTYMFAGNLMFHFFRESTDGGMRALVDNAHIFKKVNVPKYMFLLSKNVSSILNFGLTLVVFFLFVAIDGVPFSWTYLVIVYPIACMILFNTGVGLVLSAMEVFFEDTHYLYEVFILLVMYASAIFYSVDGYSQIMQRLFLCNPIYVYIKFVRILIIDGTLPSIEYAILALGYGLVALVIGIWVYKKNNHKFLYYV